MIFVIMKIHEKMEKFNTEQISARFSLQMITSNLENTFDWMYQVKLKVLYTDTGREQYYLQIKFYFRVIGFAVSRWTRLVFIQFYTCSFETNH